MLNPAKSTAAWYLAGSINDFTALVSRLDSTFLDSMVKTSNKAKQIAIFKDTELLYRLRNERRAYAL